MFVGSFLMVVGVTLSSGDETVLDMAVAGGDLLEDDGRAVDRGTKELEGLLVVVVGRAGPITCGKYENRG